MSDLTAKQVVEKLPELWFGELTGSGNGLCHIFPRGSAKDLHRLPHKAICGAATGRGAEAVSAPTRMVCKDCEEIAVDIALTLRSRITFTLTVVDDGVYDGFATIDKYDYSRLGRGSQEEVEAWVHGILSNLPKKQWWTNTG